MENKFWVLQFLGRWGLNESVHASQLSGVELLVPRVGEDPGILVVDERSAALRREKVFLER